MANVKSYLGSIVLAGLLLQGCGSDSSTSEPFVADSTPIVGDSDAREATLLAAARKLDALSSVLSEADLSAKVKEQATSDLVLKYTQLYNTDADFRAVIDGSISGDETKEEAFAELAALMVEDVATISNGPSRGIFSKIKDATKKVTGKFEDAVKKTVTKVKDVADKTKDTVKIAVEDVKDVTVKVKDTVKIATEDVKDAAGDVKDSLSVSNLSDKLKDGLVDVLDTPIGAKITSAAFDVVLNSQTVTVAMLDMARASGTTSEIMVNALASDWGLTTKMCPMLRENVEFGEKFTALAEEKEVIGKFFFERIDPTMYACLTDAMLLSNKEMGEHSYKIGKPIKHSTNGYMALLMERYATDYFIMPTGSTADRRNDKFVSLMLDTGAVTTYDSETKTFTGHGDANELINEKFFYSIFKTPTSTDGFVAAMQKITPEAKVMLMDNIFLGKPNGDGEVDTIQGYLNIISIGSAMYDGIYGEKDETGVRTNAYGFGSYTGAFIGFAGLIPGDRYMDYGTAFVNAGYEYAKFNGIDVWSGASDAAVALWEGYNSEETNATTANAPARSAGNGILASDWTDNVMDLMWSGWAQVNLSDIFDSLLDGNFDVMNQLEDQGNVAYNTIVDGRDANGTLAYSTEITNDLFTSNDNVYGFHGLVELAMQEDLYSVNSESNASYTMDDAKAAFTLPPFADITFDFVYNSASDGAMAYYDKEIDAEWFSDLSSKDLIRDYFYPSAENAYIPSWMLSIDWLTVPATYVDTTFAGTDFDFNAGYFDVYATSTKAELITEYDAILENISITKIDMGADSIIAVDENGQTLEGLYVYKIRAISQEDLDAVFTAISELGDNALSAIGLDSSNAATVATADNNTTAQ